MAPFSADLAGRCTRRMGLRLSKEDLVLMYTDGVTQAYNRISCGRKLGMNVTIRDANDAKVVDFEGSLDTSTSPDAEGRLSSLMEGEGVKILINFKKLDYISSAGLRVLLVSAKRLKSRGGELRLCHLNETVQEVFEISGFSSILKVFNTESEALEGF